MARHLRRPVISGSCGTLLKDEIVQPSRVKPVHGGPADAERIRTLVEP